LSKIHLHPFTFRAFQEAFQEGIERPSKGNLNTQLGGDVLHHGWDTSNRSGVGRKKVQIYRVTVIQVKSS
jgi:hypothetical protein